MDYTVYKSKLAEKLEEITGELKTLGIHDPHNPQDWEAVPTDTEVGEADENVSADHAEDLEERTAILADLEREYNDTMRALKKIEDGTYGVCEISGQPIEEDRLMANPGARTAKQFMDREGELPL